MNNNNDSNSNWRITKILIRAGELSFLYEQILVLLQNFDTILLYNICWPLMAWPENRSYLC